MSTAAKDGRLFTGSWRGVLAYERSGLTPVRISRGSPRWLPGAAQRWPAVRELMPVGRLSGIEDAAEFDAASGAHLDAVGVPAIDRRSREISDRHGSPLVLLCFEADPADCQPQHVRPVVVGPDRRGSARVSICPLSAPRPAAPAE